MKITTEIQNLSVVLMVMQQSFTYMYLILRNKKIKKLKKKKNSLFMTKLRTEDKSLEYDKIPGFHVISNLKKKKNCPKLVQ